MGNADDCALLGGVADIGHSERAMASPDVGRSYARGVRTCEGALFAVAAATLGFLFVGIHNAWDTVTYIAIGQWEDEGKKNSESRT